MAAKQLGFGGFALRWLSAMALTGSLFNPSGYSYFHWLSESPSEQLPLKVIAGVILVIGLVIFFRATWRSIGALGIVLVVALMAALVWLLVDLQLLTIDAGHILTWIGLVVVATVLAVGMSWSHVRRRITGQVDGDDLGD